MMKRLGRLFVIKTRWEAIFVIYALALGAVERGMHYLERFPGVGGWLLFAACTGVVFMAGAKLLDLTRPDSGTRRRKSDFVAANDDGDSVPGPELAAGDEVARIRPTSTGWQTNPAARPAQTLPAAKNGKTA